MLRAAVAGGSGYAGGELIRLLLQHPEVEIGQVTSNRLAGKPVARHLPNLRGSTDLVFSPMEALEPADSLFLCLPHGSALAHWESFKGLAPRIIDLSADFRLRDPALHARFYPESAPRPGEAGEFVYGIPELGREAIRGARYVACAGCNATAVILGLYPLYRAGVVEPDRTVAEVKVGSSEGGNRESPASHHPVRSGCLRSFKPTGHRHGAEIEQALAMGEKVTVHFSATAVDQVRGILATCHVFLKENLEEKEVWKLYRACYGKEPFIRIVKDRDGLFRYPEPKILSGTNYCDIGFERDNRGSRLVVMSAIDNLMKGAAGQAVQNLNIMYGFDERTGLPFPVCTRCNMCRMLLIHGSRGFPLENYLLPFAEKCSQSPEYQGHGFGLAFRSRGRWHLEKSVGPIWEARFQLPRSCDFLLVHARSAFRNEGIRVENNMPFEDRGRLFAFNGELHGVRIDSPGRIGAEKIMNFILRFHRGDLEAALRKAVPIILARTRRVRALNLLMTDRERIYLFTHFTEDPDYYTLYHCPGDPEAFCSMPLGEGWQPVPNGTLKVCGSLRREHRKRLSRQLENVCE